MDKAYDVWDYSIKKLKEVLVETTLSSAEIVESKIHTIYFEEYFGELKAKTLLVEYNYIDHDFLEDFSNYYVKCFKTYRRRCARLHFFVDKFQKKDFDNFLNGGKSKLSEKDLNDSYLGFLVAKPLPQTIIGRTCLKTYPKDNRRFYPARREYEANLFGIRLLVDSLAYQEQDKAVAACATSALWSIFNSTGRLFQHQILSPVEISEAACASLPLESRFFPNPGLSPSRMAQAIRSIGLEPYLIPADNQEILKAAAYAYLNCKIPMILGLVVVDFSLFEEDPEGYLQQLSEDDKEQLHAVALTGYSLGQKIPTPYSKTGFLSIASTIDQIYAHDDQVGPFARMKLNQDQLSTGEGGIKTIYASWRGHDGKIGSAGALPKLLLIPLYNKIRLPFQLIQETIIYFDESIETIRESGALPFEERLVWDIHLTTVNEVKSGMLTSRQWRNKLRMQVLIKRMPKFIWRATAFHKGRYIIDLLFDATDLEQSSWLFYAVGYDEGFFRTLIKLAKSPNLPASLKTDILWRILEWFSKQEL